MTFRSSGAEARAVLTIESDDRASPRYDVRIVANIGATDERRFGACIAVSPQRMRWFESVATDPEPHILSIESCGRGWLEITAVDLAPGSDPAFVMIPESVPQLPHRLSPAAVSGTPPSLRIEVDLQAVAPGELVGTIVVASDDPQTPETRIELNALVRE